MCSAGGGGCGQDSGWEACRWLAHGADALGVVDQLTMVVKTPTFIFLTRCDDRCGAPSRNSRGFLRRQVKEEQLRRLAQSAVRMLVAKE